MKTWIRRTLYSALIVATCTAVFVTCVIAYVQFSHINDIGLDQQIVPYAIVLGASVKQDGTPSDALYDRVATAVELYNNHSVEKLLMTGDDGKFHVDEVAIMKRTAIELGVPDEAIDVDGHGYRTYESCKRAKQEFGIQKAVIVTQRFHLGRAMYLCGQFGMKVYGKSADRQSYQRIAYFWTRDLISSFKAWWDINIQEPKPPVDASERD